MKHEEAEIQRMHAALVELWGVVYDNDSPELVSVNVRWFHS